MNTLLRKMNRSTYLQGHLFRFSLFLLANVVVSELQAAEFERSTNQVSRAPATSPLAAVLTPARWQEVEKSVDRALAWMATQQRADGSFPTYSSGQPGVTSLATMAFLSRGHQPGLGPYGQGMNRAIDFVISCQSSNGLINLIPPGMGHEDKQPSHTAVYNHAISGLMLGEVYGQVSGERAKSAKKVIEQALQFSRQLQLRQKLPADRGGWRYLRVNHTGIESDLSVTGWQIMFLRSARNAEFNVPQACMDEAMAYVGRCCDPSSGAFSYDTEVGGVTIDTRAMVGAGILSLSLGGQHQTPMALAAGDWLLRHPYRRFGDLVSSRDRFFYGTYYCSQAMAQLGGHYWQQFFPKLTEVLLAGQTVNGSWPPEVDSGGGGEAMFGTVYSTSLAVLSLTPPYQLLPVYQR